MIHVLKLSRAGYYAWLGRPESPRATHVSGLVETIRQIHGESEGTYGSPRVYRTLKARGIVCCEKTVAKLMRREGLRGANARRFVIRTTDSRHDYAIAENTLNRRFEPGEPNRVWVAEIVHSQMTKPAGLAGRPDGERIPDLDVIPGHHDPVDHQLDQLSFPLERRRVETLSHAVGKGSGMVREPSQFL